MQCSLTRCLFHMLFFTLHPPEFSTSMAPCTLCQFTGPRETVSGGGDGGDIYASYRFLNILTGGVSSSRATLECQRTKLFVEINPGRCQWPNSHPVGTFCTHPRTCIQTTKGVHLRRTRLKENPHLPELYLTASPYHQLHVVSSCRCTLYRYLIITENRISRKVAYRFLERQKINPWSIMLNTCGRFLVEAYKLTHLIGMIISEVRATGIHESFRACCLEGS